MSSECRDVDTTPALHLDDCVLVDRLLRKDPAAWHDFVTRLGPMMRSRVADVALAFGRANDDAALDDATADVFAAILANDAAALRAFAGRSSLVTYLAVITTRCATRGFARKRIVVSGGDRQEASEPSTSIDDEPIRRIIRREQQQHLLSVLADLSDKQQQVVRLFHLEGRTYAEIADTLRMPIGSVGVTLRRAEEQLRKRLQSDPPDSS